MSSPRILRQQIKKDILVASRPEFDVSDMLGDHAGYENTGM
jgi:hypothetical protein